MTYLLIKEASDPSVVYGLLTANAKSTDELAAEFLRCKASLADAEWQISDVVALLPEEGDEI